MLGPIRRLVGSRLGRTAGVYTFANVLDAVIPFALIPVLTRALAPTEYGIIAMFQILVGLVGPFIGLSVHGAVLRRFFDADRRTDIPTYIGNCILILLASSAAVGLVFAASAPLLERGTGVPAPWLGAVLVSGFSIFITHVRLAVWQAEMLAFRYGAFQLVRNAADYALSLWLVLGLGMGWEGRVIGMVGAHAVFAMVALVSLRVAGMLRFRFDAGYIRNALNFGVPLVPHVFAKYVFTAADRFFLANMVGLGPTGVYLVASQIAKGLQIVFQSFNRAYNPWLFSKLQRREAGHGAMLVRFTYVYFVLAASMGLGLGIGGPILIDLLVGDAYLGAADFLFWLALAAAFEGMYLMVTNYVFFAEKTALLATATGAAAVLNIALNYVLITVNGAVGAAQATAISLLFKFLFTWWLSARIIRLPWFAALGRGRADG